MLACERGEAARDALAHRIRVRELLGAARFVAIANACIELIVWG
jgi:predicted aconitase